jgi:hypothetical protein
MSIMIGIITITEPYPTAYAGKDSTKELCKENGGEWEDGNCNLENENLRDEYDDDVAYAEDSYAIDKQLEDMEDKD